MICADHFAQILDVMACGESGRANEVGIADPHLLGRDARKRRRYWMFSYWPTPSVNAIATGWLLN
jgi:hypothetical protein